jgi:hypothetical protein
MLFLQGTTAIGLAAAALSLGLAYSAAADPFLPVQNLTFNQISGSFNNGDGPQTKMFFNTVAPNDWSVGTAGAGGSLTYVGMQGSEGTAGAFGNIYPVYTTPGFTVTVPAGTNFFQADGNPTFENTIFQTINGLTPGTTYELTFQQAAGQQVGFTGDTTEQWKVFLGQGSIGVDCSTNPCTVVNPFGDEEVDSPVMDNASGTNTNWQPVSLNFTADATSEVLTFLAWGDGGSTTNLPPTVFLEGVNTPVVTPEPASLTLLGAGLLGLGGFVARRRAKRNPSA